jgi:hypothetical protein
MVIDLTKQFGRAMFYEACTLLWGSHYTFVHNEDKL